MTRRGITENTAAGQHGTAGNSSEETEPRRHACSARHFTRAWYGSADRRRPSPGGSVHVPPRLRAAPGGYVAAALPDLPFSEDACDLVLWWHLLLIWANHFDEHWHLAALTELARVARREVRVYPPRCSRGVGERVPFLNAMIDELRRCGHRAYTRPVSFRFQRSADAMLVIESAG